MLLPRPTPEELRVLLAPVLDRFAVRPALDRMGRYLEVLLERNALVNLVSRRTTGTDLMGHVADSLEGLAYLPPPLPRGHVRLLDVGSGGGFPAIPLLIARPDVQGILVESTGKKSAFLSEACAALGLTAAVLNARFPDSPPKEMGLFQVMTSRAVAEPLALAAAGRRFLAPGGRTLLWTTRDVLQLPGRKLRHTFHPSPGADRKGIAIVECST